MDKPVRMRIKVGLTDEDLDQLRNGERHEWTFPNLIGKGSVDIELYNEDREQEDRDEREYENRREDSCEAYHRHKEMED